MNKIQSIYEILKNFQNGQEISKEEREILINKKYIKYDENSKKVNFDGIKMHYKLTQKGKDFIDENENITI